jgi:hypothetical protein
LHLISYTMASNTITTTDEPPKSVGYQLDKVATAVSVDSDIDKKGDDFAQAAQLHLQWQEGTDAEKRLVRKLDWRILPCCWTLYLLGFLDRANIG